MLLNMVSQSIKRLDFYIHSISYSHKDPTMDQSIIVYRNPMEKYFWEHHGFGYMILFAFTMFISFCIAYTIIKKIHIFISRMKHRKLTSIVERINNYYREPDWIITLSLFIAAVAALVCCYIVNLDF